MEVFNGVGSLGRYQYHQNRAPTSTLLGKYSSGSNGPKDLVQNGECKDSFDVHPAENVLPKAFNLELHVSKSSKVRHLTV
ncbi:hypothetical protein M0804_004548 [Polistes exclamans]|nr:hypothetical protein M0804_004548 [Polistes exclamans]